MQPLGVHLVGLMGVAACLTDRPRLLDALAAWRPAAVGAVTTRVDRAGVPA